MNASRHGRVWTWNRPRHGCSHASTATPASTSTRSRTTYAIDPLRLDNAKRVLVEAGLVEGGESGTPAAGALTEKGKQTLDTLVSCGRDRLDELSVGWQPEQHPELRELIEGLARQFIDTTPAALPTRTS